MLAILAGAGLRIGEALSLRWQHVVLGTGTLYVVDSKTEKSVREVHLTAALREELTLWRADARHAGPSDYVIHTSTGHRHNPSNLRRDVLAPAVATANATLEEARKRRDRLTGPHLKAYDRALGWARIGH
ncbi:MAG: tyrosine-type recombinase/integrase [Gaiellaceae bacterium]